MQAVPIGLRAAHWPTVTSQKSPSMHSSDCPPQLSPAAASATQAVPSQRRPSAASHRMPVAGMLPSLVPPYSVMPPRTLPTQGVLPSWPRVWI